MASLPPAPRLFLVDGYALIYRAFFALIGRPLTTSRGENTSAAWGIASFLQRLIQTHRPEYLGWVHDSGLSFRHERYPAYKATREKLTEELQADFDRGMERICQLLDAYNIRIMSLEGYEADDVIGTLATQGIAAGVNVVVISGDKDFQQLVRPGVWLLNPGRGGSAAVEEQWVSAENAHERLGVPSQYVTDYLALVGDSSDNVPGVRGIGDKTARDLVAKYGAIEEIIAHAGEIAGKRPREALLQYADDARLSKELVTIRDDLPVRLELDQLALHEPDHMKLKNLFLELEFHALAKAQSSATPVESQPSAPVTQFHVVDTLAALRKAIARARDAKHIAIGAQMLVSPDSPIDDDPLRSTPLALSISVAPSEAYYLPLRHRSRSPAQGALFLQDGRDEAGTAKPARRIRPKVSAELTEQLSAAAKSLAVGDVSVQNLPPLDASEMQPLRALLEDASVSKTCHDGKSLVLLLRRAGITLRGLDFDTMIASYVLDPGRRSHDLGVLALEFLSCTPMSPEQLCGKGRDVIPFAECPPVAAREYLCGMTDIVLRLRSHFESQMAQHGATALFRDIEMPLIRVLSEMEWTGIAIDRAWFASLKERFRGAREAVEQTIYREAGGEFNINSNQQLRHILFEKLQLPTLKRTATGSSTDASVLQELAEQGHTLPTLLLEYRELAKLENTYLDALPALVHPDTGRLHTSFNQTVATTGRLSSSDPNLQNIPIRRELGRAIRRGFISRPGWRLLAADYSQIELRLLAHLSADPLFVQAFQAGGDIHRQTASIIFGVPLPDVTSEMRARAKTINFATIYGQGPHALSRQLRIEHAEARRFIAEYFERFKGIRAYLDSMVSFARDNGYVQTLFGRRRYIPQLADRNRNVQAFGERTATNSPIQGSAADLIKIAMIRIHNALTAHGTGTKMILQVHDELVFEVEPSEMDHVCELVKLEMEGAAQLSVPLVVDIGIGENWLDTKS